MYTILGLKKIDYIKKNGQQFQGYEFHLMDDDTRPHLDGNAVISIVFNSNYISGIPHVGDTCELKFTISGQNVRPSGINVLTNN